MLISHNVIGRNIYPGDEFERNSTKHKNILKIVRLAIWILSNISAC